MVSLRLRVTLAQTIFPEQAYSRVEGLSAVIPEMEATALHYLESIMILDPRYRIGLPTASGMTHTHLTHNI